MSVPDYQSLMLPLLELASDGNEHRISEAVTQLGRQINLTDADLAEMLPSGKQTIFSNRVHWAKTYMAQAGLLELTRRAFFRITDRGRSLLQEKPKRIDAKLLRRFPEFVTFQSGSPSSETSADALDISATAEPNSATPDEIVRNTVADMDRLLASELLQRILSAPPAFFESLIVRLLIKMGYGGSREEAGRAVGKSGDGGIDGIIDQDQLGLDRVYVQAKRYNADLPVGEPDIRGFSGSLGAAKASKGVFVTTSYFTKPAADFAERHPFKMVLIDGERLATLMIKHDVGVRVAETLLLKKIDEDFFSDE